MPYVITTYPQDQEVAVALEYGTGRRRAVATLEEAREAAHQYVIDAPGSTAFSDELACTRMPESGDTIGPLPDGTVIEVAPMPWHQVARGAGRNWDAGDIPADSTVGTEVIDAYNAQHAH